jgi:hypothetical protein
VRAERMLCWSLRHKPTVMPSGPSESNVANRGRLRAVIDGDAERTLSCARVLGRPRRFGANTTDLPAGAVGGRGWLGASGRVRGAGSQHPIHRPLEPEWVFSERNVVDLGVPVLAEWGPFAVDPQLVRTPARANSAE